ncbi:hypothetical protein K1719_025212 [Acacia pycnantha]|nr:hypothetical protein K1719_025212 [Acacia pycnantha]
MRNLDRSTEVKYEDSSASCAASHGVILPVKSLLSPPLSSTATLASQFGFRSFPVFTSPRHHQSTMSDQPISLFHPSSDDDSSPPSSPHSRQPEISPAAAAIILGVILLLIGLTFTVIVVASIVAIPLLVLFSPILVPAGLTIAAFSWIYDYVAGNHSPGSDRLGYARDIIADKVRDVKERVKADGQHVQGMAQDVTHKS